MKKTITTIIFLFGIFQIAQAQTVTYQYDDLNRLTQADYGGGTIIQYHYDKLGNRTQYVITGSATPPDLQPTALSVDNATVSAGGQVTLSYTLNNNGQIAAGQNTARFYINSSASLSGAVEIDDHSFSSVAGNSSTQYSQLLTIPSSTATGTQYLLIDLDADDEVAESNEGNNMASISITIQDCPNLVISFPNVTNETCEEGNGSIGAVGSGGSTPYSWEWNTISAQYSNLATNLEAGTYTVTLTDGDGCISVGSQSIINEGVDPVSGFAYSTGGLTTYFSSTSSDATSYSWSFGDGTTSTQTNPTHAYSASGSYQVCLQVTNSCDSDNSCQTVTVSDADYSLIESAPGVQLYRKQITGDDPDFIQVINLSAGAYIEFDHGDITSGAGTSNPFFTRENIDDVWTEKTGQYSNVFSITNGQFFNAGQTPAATLAFPVKQDGAMVSDGYGNTSEYVGEKEFLGIWSNLANVSPYDDNPTSVANSSAIHGIVGLDKDANKGPNNQTGRTFAGVVDEDNDGIYEKVLIFTSKTATQAYAAQQLNDMGVPFDKIIMLDGGGSTQMKCNGTDYVDATRSVPQYMVVYSAAESTNDLCSDAIPIECGETVSGTTENATIDQNIVFFEDFNQCSAPGGWQISAVDTFGNPVAATSGGCNSATMFSFECSGGFPGPGTPASGFSGCQAILDNDGAGASFVGTLYLTTPNIDLSSGGGTLLFDWQNQTINNKGTFTVEVWNGSSWNTVFTRSSDGRGFISKSLSAYSNSDFKVRFAYDDGGEWAWGTAIDNVTVTDQSGLQACGVEINAPGVWYSFIGDGNIATLSTCGQASYDTRISVFSGDCNNLVCESGNDDSQGCSSYSSKLSLPTISGQEYFVLVHGYLSSAGAFDLTLSCSAPLANDGCANAVLLPVNAEGSCPASATSGTTMGATSDGTVSCGGSNYNTNNNGVWYKFAAPASGFVNIQINEVSGNQNIVVFDACNGNEVFCEAGSNDVYVGGLTAGETYFVLVWSLSGDEGDFSICLSDATFDVYGYMAYDPTGTMTVGPVAFSLEDPQKMVSLAPTVSTNFISGGAWLNDTWYGIEYSNGNLWTINHLTGEMTMVGSTGISFIALAYDPGSDKLFAASTSDLYEIDYNTSAATSIGSFNNADAMIGISCNSSGELYGVDIGTDKLYSINTSNGHATEVGALGINIGYAQSLEFDKNSGILYLAGDYDTGTSSGFGGALFQINTDTGVATLIGPFKNEAEITSFVIPNDGAPPPFTYTSTNLAGLFRGQAQVDGIAAEMGDWIAAYDEDDNCVGATELTFYAGIAYINLNIYGDDPTTPSVDEGMNAGECFTLHLYDTSEDEYLIYPLTSNPITFCEWANTNGTPIPAYNNSSEIYNFQNTATDIIYLNPGWNLISTDVAPPDSTIATVFSTLTPNNLIYISGYYNGASFYDPDGLPFLNTLNKITRGYGYWVKVHNADVLTITGEAISPEYRVGLNASWNLIGYPPHENEPPADYFADLTAAANLIYVSGYNQGAKFYDPNGLPFLNTLTNLENSFGYWVKVHTATGFSGGSIEERNDFNGSSNYEFFNGESNLKDYVGDFVEILTQDGVICGRMEILENGYLMTTPIYGKDGIGDKGVEIGEELSFRYKDKTLSPQIIFRGNKEVQYLKLIFEEDEILNSLHCYPNPFSKDLTIDIEVENSGQYNLELIDMQGRQVQKIKLQMENSKMIEHKIEGKNLSVGAYYLVLKDKDGEILVTERVIFKR